MNSKLRKFDDGLNNSEHVKIPKVDDYNLDYYGRDKRLKKPQ